MKRRLLLFFALFCVSVGTWATITISPANVTVGGTQYSGYGIYGAKEGEIALLLSGDNSVSVQWNGASLSDLTSAEYIKVGDSQNPNLLKDEDLEALQLLSGAKFLDIDGSTLADGADITNIKAGPAIEAVTLPNNLTKEQVNAAGASLTACNENFGSCLSLAAEMGKKEIYVYTHPCTSAEVEYTGTVTGGSGHLDNITCPLTEAGSTFTYINTKFRNELSYGSASEVKGGKIEPNPLKVELTKLTTPQAVYKIEYNGKIITVPNHAVDPNTLTITQEFNSEETGYQNTQGLTGQTVTALTYNYSYTFKKGGWEQTFYIEEAQGDETNGYYAMIENVYANYGNDGYQFDVTSTYNYTYADPTDNCNVKTASFTDGPHETVDIPCDLNVDLETKTITAPVEGGKTTAIAYVNKAGTLYKATSLDANDAKEADALVISGNINNGDIAIHNGAGDPLATKNDADKFEDTATAAFYLNYGSASIKSVDMSDAVIDEYQHLRVLWAYGNNLESVVFPKTVTRIPNYCCYSLGDEGCKNLTSVVFPTEAESFTIGDYAFRHTPIKSLLIPSGVTQIGDRAFEDCDNMTDVEMEALRSSCHFGNFVFATCDALKHVTLSEKVENIGDNQFEHCGLLESIRIPSTCKTIGSESFKFCYSIHQITIPEGVELIKENAFEEAGLTDIYLMATTPAKLPKIYAMSPTGAGPSTFSYQRTTGNNTVPDDEGHLSRIGEADYDEVLTWYQEDQSGPQGLGTGNCLTALHYPESMKDFFEVINYPDISNLNLTGVVNYKTYAEYLALIPEGMDKINTRCLLENKLKTGEGVSETQARDFGTDDEGNPIEYKYLSQSYSIDPDGDANHDILLVGPDKDGRYYPIQECYLARMAAGATGTEAGGVNQGESGLPVASQWGWRQFPLSSSIESIGETPYEKEYDDTWYTMCFPWKMVDNQLFMAFNQKCEIVEFVGAEMIQSEEDEKEYSLIFHFDEVAKTYYMDDEGVEYYRERDGERVDAAGHRLYIYTSKEDPSVVLRCPDEVTNGSYNPKNADPAVKAAYGKYLSVQNIMVLPGHPYMIHPSIGAAPGSPAKVYINGVKKIVPGEGLYTNYPTLADVAESQKVARVVTSNEAGGTSTTAWKNPETGVGGTYTFIGNINDAVETDGVSDNGAQDMPTDKGPVYFLGVKPGTVYPQYFKKAKGKGQGKWSQYSAIIVPDADAIANVEGLDGMVVGGSAAPAKGYDVVFGEWEIVEPETVTTAIESAIAEEKESGKPAQIVHMNVVYNINGQVVRTDSTSVEGLPKGLYIVNGKKYMVK